jgi:hypothetical protein
MILKIYLIGILIYMAAIFIMVFLVNSADKNFLKENNLEITHNLAIKVFWNGLFWPFLLIDLLYNFYKKNSEI